jgi:tol-pal system protein YbgF
MITFSKSIVVASCLAALSYTPLQANAGLFDDDEARRAILDIRSKIDTMQHEMLTRIDTKADKSSALDLVNQNEQLGQEVAKLRGEVEVLTNELANAQRRQKDFYVDLDNRLRKFETQTLDSKETIIESAEQKQYDAAMGLFKTGDYKNASVAFVDFIQHYPQSDYAGTAQYWLGNAYYAQRDYKNAIEAQQLVVKLYPDNAKAADALLNIASSYTELKDKASAKKSLEALVAEYPASNAAQTAKQRLATYKY